MIRFAFSQSAKNYLNIPTSNCLVYLIIARSVFCCVNLERFSFIIIKKCLSVSFILFYRIKQVGFDLIERVLSDVVKRFNTEFSSSFLYLELKNYCTTVVKGMTSQLNESATMHKRYENLVQLIQSFEM